MSRDLASWDGRLRRGPSARVRIISPAVLQAEHARDARKPRGCRIALPPQLPSLPRAVSSAAGGARSRRQRAAQRGRRWRVAAQATDGVVPVQRARAAAPAHAGGWRRCEALDLLHRRAAKVAGACRSVPHARNAAVGTPSALRGHHSTARFAGRGATPRLEQLSRVGPTGCIPSSVWCASWAHPLRGTAWRTFGGARTCPPPPL